MTDIASAENFSQRFTDIYRPVEHEVAGLTAAQLDFTSPKWDWASWSIRKNLNHMSFVAWAWFNDRWKLHLPTNSAVAYFQDLTAKSMDEQRDILNWLDAAGVLDRFRKSTVVVLTVLSKETPASMRAKWLPAANSGFMAQVAAAHPTGYEADPQAPGHYRISFEATFRHIYYELTTHLYNIQRIKRAQGLKTVTKTPVEGYHTLPHWDRSEP
ncbi:MAG: hypothetical protein FJ039_03085 [Chloroflexi bacterium]|nr:hypothetical protein [Chloroflexota bacterium]